MAQIILDSNNNLIQGDFDNATLNNRTKLQTTTTNATTNVYVVPNGSSTSAGVSVANNSSLTNASKIVMATNGSTDTQIISGVNGSGTYLPMSFYVNNALAVQYGTAGEIKLGAGASAGTSGQVLTSGGSGAAVSWTTVAGGVTSLNGQTGAITNTDFGAIGSYVLANGAATTNYGMNDTIAGSSLQKCSTSSPVSLGSRDMSSAGFGYINTMTSAGLSGTWRSVSVHGNSTGVGGYASTGLWVRIS